MKKREENGFTLIELLGVIVIMCIILLAAFPSTVKLIKQNANRKYDSYYKLIESAAVAYADQRKDDLGGVNGEGCVEVNLKTLIDSGLLQQFDDDEVNCDTPSSTNQAKVRITNKKGKITTEVSLICLKNKKVVYENVKSVTSACQAFVPKEENVLVTMLNEKLAGKVTQDGTAFYVTGANPNNYVLYSGRLWRVISYDMSAKTVKLVLDDVVSVGNYSNFNDGSGYLGSNILSWLENEFLPTLRDTDRILSSENWNYTTLTSAVKPGNTNVRRGKVGLLNLYEYNKVRAAGYLNSNANWWLISPFSPQESWYVSANNATHGNVTTMNGIRPTITLQSQITYIDGDVATMGTKTNPFRVSGEVKPVSETPLNSRYPGEYVQFDNKIYRIVSTSSNSTKLVLNDVLDTTPRVFDTTYTEFSTITSLGIYLNTNWYNSMNATYRDMIIDGEWCTELVDGSKLQQSSCGNNAYIKISKIGLLKIGEQYAGPIGYEYWTLSSYALNTKVNLIKTNGTIGQKGISDTSYVRPAFYVSPDVKITSGNGTQDSPYLIKK